MITPDKIFINVLLPAPFSPHDRVEFAPLRMSNVTSSSAVTTQGYRFVVPTNANDRLTDLRHVGFIHRLHHSHSAMVGT